MGQSGHSVKSWTLAKLECMSKCSKCVHGDVTEVMRIEESESQRVDSPRSTGWSTAGDSPRSCAVAGSVVVCARERDVRRREGALARTGQDLSTLGLIGLIEGSFRSHWRPKFGLDQTCGVQVMQMR